MMEILTFKCSKDTCFANLHGTCVVLKQKPKGECKFNKPNRDMSLVNGEWKQFPHKYMTLV